MNPATDRYLPMVLAGIVILGCILPFSGSGHLIAINVFSLPTLFRQLGSVVGATAVPVLAYAIYLIPVMAGLLLWSGLAGAVSKRRQLAFGVANILLCVLLPGVVGLGIAQSATGEIAKMGRELGKQMGLSILDFLSVYFGAGGWLIILASIGLILSGLGKIKIAP
ncbi:MAG: hypothetical protein WAN86_10435 [Hyphomicrobiaceae bacterium]